MKESTKHFIDANISVLVYGNSGWGKTQIVKQCAEELNMKCYVLSLAGVAPEDFGIPSTQKTHYQYLPPKWAYNFHKSQESFVLFLDEITQATVQVMHAIYPLVLEKRVGDLHLPNMRIIAASNHEYENQNLTPIMQPLLNRFDVIVDLEKDFGDTLSQNFWKYIKSKYKNLDNVIDVLFDQQITTNPRAYEVGFNFIQNNPQASKQQKMLVLRRSFGDLAPVVLKNLKQEIIENETNDNSRIRHAARAFKNKMLFVDGKFEINPTKELISNIYNLSEEEKASAFI